MPENDLVLKSIDGVFSLALCLFMSFSLYVLKSHKSFTYVSPDVFSVSYKLLIINVLQDIVRVSFSAPNASQPCGAFLLCPGLRYSAPVQVSLVQEIFSKTTFRCTSLANLPVIDPIPIDLIRKTRREAHLEAQARLVHRAIGSAGFCFQ